MYRTIAASFWTDPKVKGMNPVERLVVLYLITNPHTHVSGIYALNLGYASLDLGLKEREVKSALDTLSRLGIALYDQDKDIVWVRNMFAYQGRGEKNAKSAAYHIREDLHGSYLGDLFIEKYPEIGRVLGRPERKNREIPNWLRLKVLERDHARCLVCGATAEKACLEIDHILPVSKGGKTEEPNLRVLCDMCNNGKSDRVSQILDRVSDFDTPDPLSPIPEQEQEQEQENRTGTGAVAPVAGRNGHVPIEVLGIYGEFGNVRLSIPDHAKLVVRLAGNLERFIDRLDRWGAEEPAKFRKKKSHYATILNWFDRDLKDGKISPDSVFTNEQRIAAAKAEVERIRGGR